MVHFWANGTTPTWSEAPLKNQQPYEPLVLCGTPRQRGRAHGETLRPLIQELFSAWEEEVQREVAMSLPTYLRRFRGEVDFLPALERWTPDLLLEVQGISEGANLPLVECRCLQYLDEHWHHLGQLQEGRLEPSACSSVGGGRPRCLGQNMDLPRYLDGFQTLLRLRYADSDLELLVPSFAGLIGLYGINCRGLGVCVNTLSQLRTSPTGLPVAYVVRSTLERASLEDAVDHLRSVPHASGQNYLVGGPSGLVDLECSAGAVVRYGEGTAVDICHTNHPLATDDLGEGKAGWDVDRAEADLAHGLTFSRLEQLERGLGRQPLTVEQVKRLLEEVAHPPDGPFDVSTFCSAVFELGARPRAHVALGPPGTPYQQIPLA